MEMTHHPNLPYQLGTSGDKPSDSVREKHVLQKKDLVVAATDGLWDNLFLEQIAVDINLINDEATGIVDISVMANLLMRHSSNVAYSNEKVKTPFNVRMNEDDKELLGGKPDDISIVVCQYI